MRGLRPIAVLPIAGAFTLLAALGILYFPGRSHDSHLQALRAKALRSGASATLVAGHG